MNQQGRITRSSTDRVIAGVCGGVARYLNLAPTLIRVAFVVLTFFGISPWVYLLLWVAIPSDTSTAQGFGQQLQESVGEIQQRATQVVDQVQDRVQQFTNNQGQTPPPPQTPNIQQDNGPATGQTRRLNDDDV